MIDPPPRAISAGAKCRIVFAVPAMFTALASLFLNRPVHHDVAMPGEITLRGLVLPIGGLKEKLLAAHRAGLFEVILPQENEKDVAEVPENLRTAMKLHFVDNMDQVLAVAELVAGRAIVALRAD